MTLHVLIVGKTLKDMTSLSKKSRYFPTKGTHRTILLSTVSLLLTCLLATVHYFYITLSFVTHVASALTRSHHLGSLYRMLLKF